MKNTYILITAESESNRVYVRIGLESPLFL